MAIQGEPKSSRLEKDAAQRALARPSARYRRLQIAAVAAIGVAVGIALALPGRRGDDLIRDLAGRHAQQAEPVVPAGRTRSTSAIPVPQTAQDLIAEAEQVAARLVASFPESPEALVLMGTVYSRFGNSAKAIDCWEECLKRDPDNAEADYHLGIAAKTQGEYETAAAHLQKASARNPRLAGVHAVLAECLMCLGRAEEAVALLQKATETDAATAQDFFILGQALLQLQEHEKAKRSFQAALSLSPDYPFAYYGLFRACAALGQTEEAEQYRERFESFKLKGGMPAPVQEQQDDLKQVGKIVADFLRIAGLIRFNHAQADCAEELWRRAATLDPDNPAPRQLLAALFRSQGRQEEALQVLRPGQTAATESQEKSP